MKSYEKKRRERDQQIDQLLSSEEGQSEYWSDLMDSCQADSMISLLESTLHLPGDVIECGVYRGGSAQKIVRILAERAPDKIFYACDSFEGFPEEKVGRIDLAFMRFLSRVRQKFRMCSDTPDRLKRIFAAFNVRGKIVKGYFSNTLHQFESSQFCFIHLDVDLYESYKECLSLLYKNLTPGGVVVFDDYKARNWPGAAKAVDEFFAALPEDVAYCTDRHEPSWYVRKPLAGQAAA